MVASVSSSSSGAPPQAWGAGVVRFFALAVGITWALQLPGVLAAKGLLPGGQEPYMLAVVLGVFGPFAAAYLVRRGEGAKGWRHLFRSPSAQRPSLLWLLGAVLLPGVLLSGALALHRLAGGFLPLAYFPDPPGRLVIGLLISIVEEVGWRGFALPRLSRAVGRVRASLVLGVVWTIWHVPMFLGQGISVSLFPLMLVFFTAGSVVLSWLYFRTGGSLLACILLHFGSHLNNSHLPLPSEVTPVVLHTIAWVVVAALVLIGDKKTLSAHRD